MPSFSPEITDFWSASFVGDVLASADRFTVTVNSDFEEDSPAMVLHTAENGVRAVLSPGLAAALSPTTGQVTPARLCAPSAGLRLKGATSRNIAASSTTMRRWRLPEPRA
ncbi:hypothetical protein [Ensifer sp. ENS09]|uniref:hypothetical protein n=1 Tax=Ensifer sp. ENS09 TaxID=2769263 RepID=UPI001AEE9735|nr:hypothetical protein [Ensifer sp. ENS09]